MDYSLSFWTTLQDRDGGPMRRPSGACAPGGALRSTDCDKWREWTREGPPNRRRGALQQHSAIRSAAISGGAMSHRLNQTRVVRSACATARSAFLGDESGWPDCSPDEGVMADPVYLHGTGMPSSRVCFQAPCQPGGEAARGSVHRLQPFGRVCLVYSRSAVDHERVTGHEACMVGAQPQHGRCHLRGLAHPAHWCHLLDHGPQAEII